MEFLRSERLSAAQRRLWDCNGWLVLDDLLGSDVRARLDEWVGEVSRPAGSGERRLHYFEQTEHGRALCRTERYIEDHAGLRSLITEGVLPEVAAELLGEGAVLYKEKVNYKQPGGAGFAPHQDATAYAFIKHHVTCMVAVDPMTAENGCLEFSPYARSDLLPENGEGCIAPALAGRLEWRTVEVPAGGVVFFTSYVPHQSGFNRSAKPRRALYLTYNAASEGDRRAEYYAERDKAMATPGAEGKARISVIGHFQGEPAP
jgi:ectoine hydroxylase-related dioxygenase (phytanoyl-CoA dioxygenase family)